MADFPKGAAEVNGFMRSPIVATEGGKLEAPDEIVPSYSALRYLYQSLRQSHIWRINLYTEIQGLDAGNPPYDPAELEENGLSHIANFNPLDAAATLDKCALALYNLTNQTRNLIKVEFYNDNKDPEMIRYADIIAEEWSRVMRNWPPFQTRTATNIKQLVDLGLSVIVWTDEKDWQWDTVQMSQCYLPDESQTDIEKLTVMALETNYTIQYIWEVYNAIKDLSEEALKEQPWDKEALEIYLLERANSFATANYGGQFGPFINVQQIQTQIQNNDGGFFNQYMFDNVCMVSMLYKEYNSKISRYMFDRDYSVERPLYRQKDQYASMQDAFIIYTRSPGVFTYHSNRGVGHKILAAYTAVMQNDCSLVDMAKWATTLLVQSQATGAKDAEAIRFVQGSVTHIGNSVVQENTLGGNIGQVIDTSKYLYGKTERNLANGGDDPSVPDQVEGSLSDAESKNRAAKEMGVLKFNINHYYNTEDLKIRKTFVKMLQSSEGDPGYKYAAAFRKNCLRRGVPEELLDHANLDYREVPEQFKELGAVRVAGDGSTANRLMQLDLLTPYYGEMGPRERREVRRERIEATVGSEYLDVFMQDSDNADEVSGGVSLATVENFGIKMGEMPFASADNEQKSHLITHIALGNDIVRQVSQQLLKPIEADKMFNVLIPHILEHADFASKSVFNKEFMEKVKKPIAELQRYAEFNRRNAAQQMQAELKKRETDEAKTQEVMSDAARKDFVAQRDAARDDYKVQQQVERAKEANATRGEVMREGTREKASNERLDIALKAENKQTELQAKTAGEIRSDIAELNGSTISPYDIETP